MCGRYSVGKEKVKLQIAGYERTFSFEPCYNAAPTQQLPVILIENGSPVSRSMRWGWTRPDKPLLINVRSESLFEYFPDAARVRRCLIPANGWYEWEKNEHGLLPWRFVLKDAGAFCFAGIWQTAVTPDHKELELDFPDQPPRSCTQEQFAIITRPANAIARKIHNRMPVIVGPGHYNLWLDAPHSCTLPDAAFPRKYGTMSAPRKPDTDLLRLALQGEDAETLDPYRVGKCVNNVRYNSSECFKPV